MVAMIDHNKLQWCGLRSSVLGQDQSEIKKVGLGLSIGLVLAGLVLCCTTRSCYARRHNDFWDQQWRSLS